MKLADLIKKEEVRTKTEIKVPEVPASQKIFKKERPWLDNSSAKITKTSLEHNNNISGTTLRTSLEHNKNISKTNRNISKTETKTVLETKLKHNENISKTNREVDGVVGLQRKILDIFFKKAQLNASLNTGKIYTEVLAEQLNCTVETVRTSIQRLEKKSHIVRDSFKKGRGGFSTYSLTNDSYQKIAIENNSKTSLKHNENISNTETKTETKTQAPYSSSINLNNTTTEEAAQFSIAENLSKVGIGQKQLISILNLGTLSFDDIQSSLDQYSYDLSKNKKANLALFFGILRKGSSYVSQEYTQILEVEISKELSRISRYQELEKVKLKSEMYQKFQIYKNNNPKFIEEIKSSQRFNISENILENIAFSKFCEMNND